MNIVHVIPALTKGGAERVVVDLANQAVAKGHTVSVILAYPVDPALLQDELDDRIAVHFLRRKRGRIAVYASLPIWIMRHWSFLANSDIVHCHLTFGSVFGEALRRWRNSKRAANPKIVETYHAVGAPISGSLREFHRYLAARRDGFVMMASDQHWSQFVAGQPQIETALIANGIPVPTKCPSFDESREYRLRSRIPAGVRVFGTIGRLVDARRPDDLMEVFLEVAGRCPDIHFLFAGEGEKRAAIEQRANGAGFADRFHFPGLVMKPEEALANIDLYLSLNVGEVTGVAALEAAAAGIPVIAFQASEDWHPTGNEWIYSSADPNDLATRAIELLESEKLRLGEGQRQRRVAERRFSSDRMADDYFRFYRRVGGGQG